MLAAAWTSLLVAALLEPVIIASLTRRAVYDVPGERSSHLVPTPRGGGLGVVAGIVAGVLIARNSVATGMLAGIALAASAGLVEDLRGLSVRTRLLVTAVAAACLAVALAPRLDLSSTQGLAILVVTIPWTMALVNAVNFMDGINGISAATVVIAGCAYAGYGAAIDSAPVELLGVVTAAAAAGFAPYNVPRARVFLGDVGSYGLGAALAAASLLAVTAGLALEAAVAPVLIYLADTGVTILRRARDREPLHQPHRRHVYQRLVAAGLPHVKVSVAVGALTALCAGLGAVSLFGSPSERVLAALGMLVVTGGYLASPHLMPQRNRFPA